MDSSTWSNLLQWLLVFMGIALVLALFVGLWVWRTVQRIRVPQGAGFMETMRLTPFSVVVLLDLLDFGLDFFSAPLSWVILSHLGLTKLRAATVVEALIPGTQLLPTMTTAWLVVRFFGPRLSEIPYFDEVMEQGAQRQLDQIPKRYKP